MRAGDDAGGASNARHDGGRGLSFVLNRNRLNVALSRAQCLAIVVGSTRLVEVRAMLARDWATDVSWAGRLDG